MHAGTGSEIDDMIRREYCFFVVLNNNDCVANVAQVNQRAEQASIVSLMQTD